MALVASRRSFLLGSLGVGAALAVEHAFAPRHALAQQEEGQAIVGDVIDFSLTPRPEWAGSFGWVTFTLHEGWFNGESAYFIRSDVSDEAVATQEQLVYVPRLAAVLTAGESAYANVYMVTNGADGQKDVLSSVPGQADYSPIWRVNEVTFSGDPALLTSVAEIDAAVSGGSATVTPTDVVLNYPVVKWPGGEMPQDTEFTEYLGPGQLVGPVNVTDMTVTFKLHQCYPGVRYIVTDVGMEMGAQMMNIANSPGVAPTAAAGAAAKIYVFGNGVAGSGPMGGQPSVFDSSPGEPKWSPLWEHFTEVWQDGATPRVLTNEAEVLAAEQAGEIQRFNGTPDTHPTSFVVNCPSPVMAAVTWSAGPTAMGPGEQAGAGPAQLPATGQGEDLRNTALLGAAGVGLAALGWTIRRRMQRMTR